MAYRHQTDAELLRGLQRAEATTLVLARRSGDRAYPHPTRPHRTPPLPFHAGASAQGQCRVCGQPIYRDGSHRPGPEAELSRQTWHAGCVTTYFLWTTPSKYARALIWRQKGLCAMTGESLLGPNGIRTVEIQVDHKIPLYRVAREHGALPWFEQLRFWGLGNLRALSVLGHKIKNEMEAAERAEFARATNGTIEMPLLAAPAFRRGRWRGRILGGTDG